MTPTSCSQINYDWTASSTAMHKTDCRMLSSTGRRATHQYRQSTCISEISCFRSFIMMPPERWPCPVLAHFSCTRTVGKSLFRTFAWCREIGFDIRFCYLQPFHKVIGDLMFRKIEVEEISMFSKFTIRESSFDFSCHFKLLLCGLLLDLCR